MLSSRFANVLPKLKTICHNSNEKIDKIISNADKTPIYGIMGGILTGCYAVTCTRDDKMPDRMVTIGLSTIGGYCFGFIATPVLLMTSPLVVPVGLFVVYDNYKHKKQTKQNKQ